MWPPELDLFYLSLGAKVITQYIRSWTDGYRKPPDYAAIATASKCKLLLAIIKF